MLRHPRDRHVRSREISTLEDILWEWVALTERTVRSWAPDDVPWWYNERASLSVLAGAVWRAGGTAFEEYADKKSTPGRASRAGRVDLHMGLGARNFILEAKQTWSGAGRGNPATRIRRVLERAVADVRRAPSDGDKRLAAVFAVPEIPASQQDHVDDRIDAWLEALQEVEWSLIAWVFPPSVRRLRSKRGLYPGVALLLRLVR